MNLLSMEGKYPMERNSSELENTLPVSKLRSILMKLLSFKQNNTNLINKYTEYLLFDDILFYTWKLLPSLTAKSNPNEIYIMNYLLLLEKLQIYPNNETKYLCESEYGTLFSLMFILRFIQMIVFRFTSNFWQSLNKKISEPSLAMHNALGTYPTNSQATLDCLARKSSKQSWQTATSDWLLNGFFGRGRRRKSPSIARDLHDDTNAQFGLPQYFCEAIFDVRAGDISHQIQGEAVPFVWFVFELYSFAWNDGSCVR